MISELAGMLGDPLMQRALVVACLVGLVAPVIGTYLVQRRLSLLGDGIGHVALTGVALGWLVGNLTNLVPKDALAMSVAVLAVGVGLRAALFAVCHDEEFARAAGLPVRALNITIAVVAALTVTVAMRVVGVLLVSALMIVPVAVAQLVTSSFRRTMLTAMAIGVVVCVSGLTITYWHDASPGATIVVLAIGLYALVAAVRPLVVRARRNGIRDPHPDVADDVVLTSEDAR